MSVPVHISISIVSHGQIGLIQNLLTDLQRIYPTKGGAMEVILTLNLPETLPFAENDFPFSIKLICNPRPLGFGANHNQAFCQASGQFFAVVNPDIRLDANPFPVLLACLSHEKTIGLVAPVVLSPAGQVEDSARKFPTPFKILCKAFGYCRGSDYHPTSESILPEWIGGMFMLFRRSVFQQLGGFDERYFLYYEDVDLCARLRLAGYRVMLSPHAQVVHHAQRSSHRHLRYLKWHLASMMRFFCSSVFWRIVVQKLTGRFKP